MECLSEFRSELRSYDLSVTTMHMISRVSVAHCIPMVALFDILGTYHLAACYLIYWGLTISLPVI